MQQSRWLCSYCGTLNALKLIANSDELGKCLYSVRHAVSNVTVIIRAKCLIVTVSQLGPSSFVNGISMVKMHWRGQISQISQADCKRPIKLESNPIFLPNLVHLGPIFHFHLVRHSQCIGDEIDFVMVPLKTDCLEYRWSFWWDFCGLIVIDTLLSIHFLPFIACDPFHACAGILSKPILIVPWDERWMRPEWKTMAQLLQLIETRSAFHPAATQWRITIVMFAVQQMRLTVHTHTEWRQYGRVFFRVKMRNSEQRLRTIRFESSFGGSWLPIERSSSLVTWFVCQKPRQRRSCGFFANNFRTASRDLCGYSSAFSLV